MTLIIAANSFRAGTLLATDRLLTYPSGTAFDRIATKALIFRARDALVALCFTGIAYLEGKPADHIIAEELLGRTIPINPDGSVPVFTHRFRSRLNPPLLEDAITRVIVRLRSSFENPSIDQTGLRLPFMILYSGWWEDRRRRLRPILGGIEKWPGQTALHHYRRKRREVFRGAGLVAPGVIGAGIKDLQKVWETATTRAEQDAVFVEAIRRVAAENKHVGPDCTLIRIHPYYHPAATVRFLKQRTANANPSPLSGDTGRRRGARRGQLLGGLR